MIEKKQLLVSYGILKKIKIFYVPNFIPEERKDRKGRKLYHYIYMTTFPDGYFYVGQRQSHDPYNDNYYGSGKYCKIFKEYYKKNCTKYILMIIPYCNLWINLWEMIFINRYKKLLPEYCLNILDGPPYGMFETHVKGELHWNYGRNLLQETKEKISKKLKGRKLPNEVKAKMKEAANRPENKKRVAERTKGKPSPMKGKKQTITAKNKISQNKKGVKLNLTEEERLNRSTRLAKMERTPEMRQKIREANLGKKLNPKTKAKLKISIKASYNDPTVKKNNEQHLKKARLKLIGSKFQWVNNGVNNKRWPLDENIPEGFIKGYLKLND